MAILESRIPIRVIPGSDVDPEFMQGMADAMAVGFQKYGSAANHNRNLPETLRRRLREYEITGNAFFLIDVANFAMMEYQYPSPHIQNRHVDGAIEGPGHVSVEGKIVNRGASKSAVQMFR